MLITASYLIDDQDMLDKSESTEYTYIHTRVQYFNEVESDEKIRIRIYIDNNSLSVFMLDSSRGRSI